MTRVTPVGVWVGPGVDFCIVKIGLGVVEELKHGKVTFVHLTALECDEVFAKLHLVLVKGVL